MAEEEERIGDKGFIQLACLFTQNNIHVWLMYIPEIQFRSSTSKDFILHVNVKVLVFLFLTLNWNKSSRCDIQNSYVYQVHTVLLTSFFTFSLEET